MNSIIQALYDGEISPAEQFRPQSKEYAILRQKHFQQCEELNKKLDHPLKQDFERFPEEKLATFSFDFPRRLSTDFGLEPK